MFAKYRLTLNQCLLELSLVIITFILINGLNFKPLRAQTSDTVQAPNTVTQTPLPSLRERLRRSAPPLPEPETPSVLPPPEDLLQPPATTPTPETIPSELPGNIIVERFEVVGSTVFSLETLAAATAQFTKKPISFAELLQASAAIAKLYTDQGYITSGAFIPANQTFKTEGSIVKIQVIEGSLEDIRVTGTGRLNSNYVRSRLAIATSQPLNVNELLEALQLLQLNPLIRNISAELTAGTRPGTNLLEVNVVTADTFSAQINLDNNRAPSIGSFQRQIQLNEANLLGLGDGLSVAYTNTDGSDDLDASYILPINPRNGTLRLSYGNRSSNVIEEPFDILDIEGDSQDYELTFRQPISQTPTQEFALGLTAARRESDIGFLESLIGRRIGFPSPGADEEGRTSLSVLRFFQDWTQRSSREVIAARSQFSLGIGAFDATINEDPPDSRFFAWRGQAQYVRLLAPETLLLIRADAQLADRALVPIEQIGLGGLETVRGYRQDLLLTDNGVLASAELRLPILRVSEIRGVLQITPFIDFGTAWNNSNRDNPDPNTLASIGLGLRWQQGNNLTARFDWGIPLIDVSSRGDTLQEQGLYFSLVYSPF